MEKVPRKANKLHILTFSTNMFTKKSVCVTHLQVVQLEIDILDIQADVNQSHDVHSLYLLFDQPKRAVNCQFTPFQLIEVFLCRPHQFSKQLPDN